MSPALRRRYPRLARQMRGAWWRIEDVIGFAALVALIIGAIAFCAGLDGDVMLYLPAK